MKPACKVCFVTLVLSQYRVTFHKLVRDILARRGIDYQLVYSDPTGDAAAKGDTASLDWATRVPVTDFRVAGQTFHWQSAGSHIKDADLTIVSQENKLLLNYWLQMRYMLFGKRMGFFGHGRSSAGGRFPRIGRILKRFLATRVHWWFAYTPEVADLIADYGFPRDRISINYNSIDMGELLGELATIDDAELDVFRRKHGIGPGRIGLYLGALYKDKRIDFLIEAAKRIRARVPDFELVVVGAGPEAHVAEKAAEEHGFIHAIGPLFGRDKAVALKAAATCLLPGAVGLAILDTFAAACPLITTNAPGHGPEITYLTSGENGILVDQPDSIEAYSDAVVRVMTDQQELDRLRDGARTSADHYSIENMARHFSDGVIAATRGVNGVEPYSDLGPSNSNISAG